MGDYVDYTENKNNLEYGTIMESLGNGKFVIRPHRTQGDFVADASKLPIRVIKDAQAIRALQPKMGEYTIDSCGLKKSLIGAHTFFQISIEANLAKVANWAKKNALSQVVVWYDGHRR